jgi:hypothetical protein
VLWIWIRIHFGRLDPDPGEQNTFLAVNFFQFLVIKSLNPDTDFGPGSRSALTKMLDPDPNPHWFPQHQPDTSPTHGPDP